MSCPSCYRCGGPAWPGHRCPYGAEAVRINEQARERQAAELAGAIRKGRGAVPKVDCPRCGAARPLTSYAEVEGGGWAVARGCAACRKGAPVAL